MLNIPDNPTPSCTSVHVALAERSYDILVGRGLIEDLGARIAALRPGRAPSVGLVTDENVASRHLARAEQSLRAAGVRPVPVVVPPGERSKSWSGIERVCEALLQARLERGDFVVALGGGVVGDLAGFAAAIMRRGVAFVQVPTTLLAQVDSSVGGKTGINAGAGKNLVGAFHQPELVIADTALLDTLPAREMRAGYAEVVKYGLINDPPFFNWLSKNWEEVLSGGRARDHAVVTSCSAKAGIVSRDERETGERALLNLGHTFGHALEAAAGFSDRLLHGEAVAIGMVLAFEFSERLGLCSPEAPEAVRRHLATIGLPLRIADIPGHRPRADELMDLIGQDKKVRDGALTFILTRGIGQAFVAHGVEPQAVRAFLGERIESA